jgi:hypothetical protein
LLSGVVHCKLPLQVLGMGEIFEGAAGEGGMQIHTMIPAAAIAAKVKLVLEAKWRLPDPILPSDD